MLKKRDEETRARRLRVRTGGFSRDWEYLVEKLGDLKETRRATLPQRRNSRLNKEVKGMYGFTVKMGLGDEPAADRAFWQHSQGTGIRALGGAGGSRPWWMSRGGGPRGWWWPRDAGHLRGRPEIELDGDLLTIVAKRGDKKYRKRSASYGQLCPREDADQLQQRSR